MYLYWNTSLTYFRPLIASFGVILICQILNSPHSLLYPFNLLPFWNYDMIWYDNYNSNLHQLISDKTHNKGNTLDILFTVDTDKVYNLYLNRTTSILSDHFIILFLLFITLSFMPMLCIISCFLTGIFKKICFRDIDFEICFR